jgi:type I restriction enzyme R subunit
MPTSAPPEWQTRKERVDPKLESAGWRIISERKFDPGKPLSAYDRCAIEEYPTENGPADYGLCVGGTNPWGCRGRISKGTGRA